jgi:hypothetical protein
LGLENEMISQKNNFFILDNAPCHVVQACSANEFLFLPKNTTSLIQPFDMGIIKSFKNHYFNVLIESFVVNRNLIDECSLKDISVKEAIVFCSMAWDRVKPETIINCFTEAFDSAKSNVVSNEIIVNEETMSELIDETIEELNDQKEEIFENDNFVENFDVEVEIKRGIENLKSMSRSVNLLAVDSLKKFSEFRIGFLNTLRKKF